MSAGLRFGEHCGRNPVGRNRGGAMGIEWSSQLALAVLRKRVWSRARGEAKESEHFVVVGQWIETPAGRKCSVARV